jgi:hypothetical protein
MVTRSRNRAATSGVMRQNSVLRGRRQPWQAQNRPGSRAEWVKVTAIDRVLTATARRTCTGGVFPVRHAMERRAAYCTLCSDEIPCCSNLNWSRSRFGVTLTSFLHTTHEPVGLSVSSSFIIKVCSKFHHIDFTSQTVDWGSVTHASGVSLSARHREVSGPCLTPSGCPGRDALATNVWSFPPLPCQHLFHTFTEESHTRHPPFTGLHDAVQN